MIEDLLLLVAQGGIHSYKDLTNHLSISLPLLEAMLEDLARLGYLRRLESECGTGHCNSCSSGACSIAGPGRIWTLTEKGARAAVRP